MTEPGGRLAPTAAPPQSPAVVFWRADPQEPARDRGRGRARDLLPAGAVRAVRGAVSAGGDGPAALLPSAAVAALDRADGSFSLRPVRARDARRPILSSFGYEEDAARELPLRFFVRGDPYELLGMSPTDRHLFGVDAPGRIYLLGTRLVRPRRAVAPAVRRADLADRRPGRHRDLVHARAAARRHLRLLRRLSSTR